MIEKQTSPVAMQQRLLIALAAVTAATKRTALLTAMNSVGSSPTYQVARGVECLYAIRGDLTPEQLERLAEAADMCAEHSLFLPVERSMAIATAARIDLGLVTREGDGADPEPDEAIVAAAARRRRKARPA